jgi:predicted dehydrogenase
MSKNVKVTRRDFAKKTAAITAASAFVGSTIPHTVLGANDRINIAVSGINGRGGSHINEWTKMKGVNITYLVDPDTKIFSKRIAQIDKLGGPKPKTVMDLREALEDKDLDAVSTASPDHWHALQAVWACQAGKHVYAEKPLSHNIWEGRKMVEAARKYNRVVQTGMQNRNIFGVRKAMEFLHSGELGDIYMAKGLCYKKRNTIGTEVNAQVPDGLDWDLWLGPAQWRPFNPQLVHYKWHWFWDFGCTDLGNQGPHQMDIARWGLNKNTMPTKIKCVGGKFAFDDDQETPNTQMATMEWDDGKLLQFEVRGLYTNSEENIRIGNLFYGTKGWMHLNGDKWHTYLGYNNEPGPKYEGAGDIADPNDLAGAGGSANFMNFIDAVRADDYQLLNADVLDGNRSTMLCHLANISYRVGAEVEFDNSTERFIGNERANGLLRRRYRHPYVIPNVV